MKKKIIRYTIIELGANSNRAKRNRPKVKVPIYLDENGKEYLAMLEMEKIKSAKNNQ